MFLHEEYCYKVFNGKMNQIDIRFLFWKTTFDPRELCAPTRGYVHVYLAYTSPKYRVSVYRTIGPLVFHSY